MKLIAIMILGLCMHVSAKSYSQNVTYSGKNVSIEKVFQQVYKQTGYIFFYTEQQIRNANTLSVSFKNAPLSEVLLLCFSNQPFTYLIVGKTIVVKDKTFPAIRLPEDTALIKIQPGNTVKVHVTDSAGNNLNGATVSLEGKNYSTKTDAEGNAIVNNTDKKDELIISYIGYTTEKIKINRKNFIEVTLRVKNTFLDEVQIIGYGTTTKRFNPGDITTITADEIAKNPVNNVLEALQGKVPGLFIQQTTGQPGGAFSIRLRNAANFSSVAIPPLIIVDGVRYPSGTIPMSTDASVATGNFLQGGNGLNYLNPNDIERIDVLKDADATAIYGSAGAYGVILITTKSARTSVSPSLNANVYTGVSLLGRMAPLLNTQQYVMLRKEAIANDGLSVLPTDLDVNGTWDTTLNENWRKQFLGSGAQTTNADVSYTGGNATTNYLISGSIRNNGNIQKHKGTSGDGTLRFSLNTGTLNGKFKMSLSGTYLSSVSTMVPYDFSTAALTPPDAPPAFKADGSIDWASIGTNINSSAIASNINRTYRNVTNNFLANSTLTYKPINKLTLRTTFSFNDITGKELAKYPSSTFAPTTLNIMRGTKSLFHHYESRSISISPYAEFDTKLGSKGNLNLKAGGEIDNQLTYQDEITGTGFASDAMLSNPASASSVATSYSQTPFKGLGFFGIIKYIWDQKYIIDLNGRRDGSTKFGPSNRFGNFGSIGGAWIFTEEKWIKENLSFLSYGKLRGSIGVIGGDAIGNYQYLSLYSAQNITYGGATGFLPGSLANPYLQWERNKDKEIALELGFLNNRIYIEGNYYSNKVANQLVSQPLSTVTGFSGYTLNSDAVIRNSGWEITLNTTNIKNKLFSWNTNFNISIPSSKLLKMPSLSNQNTNFVLGKPVTGIKLYKYNGVNPTTGYYSFTNADGVKDDYYSLTQTDKTEFRDLSAKEFGSIENSFTYGQLTIDFSINFTKRLGQNMLAQYSIPFGMMGLNGSTLWLNRWQKAGDITNVPKVSTQVFGIFRQELYQSSTGAYTDASYARLQNVSVRYSFKDKILKKIRLKALAIYLQGQNLMTFSKFNGLDPENLNAAVIPPLRVFTAGINLTL
ncbi:MAG: SusC/RagA family TonB-linked outer membrane protein [Arachidicoccus sp.]|nr:SusC/RagA family TonB-linked outer membrane protein [Arachidicoccus sp.]